jgi:hypothetical protein
MTITSGGFAIYLPALRAYLSDIPIYSPSYGATESFIGIALWPSQPESYVLATDAAYFEFIPVDQVDDDDPSCITLDQLVIGQRVEIVLTNFAGLYRYRLGDIVEIVGFHHRSPILQFRHRRSDHFALVGEHTTSAHINSAIQQWSETWLKDQGCLLVDYTTSAEITSPPHYAFYLEVVGNLPFEALIAGARQLDNALIASNPDLKGYRRDKLLGEPRLHLLVPGTFKRLHDQQMTLESQPSRNQFKVPRTLQNEAQHALINQCIVSSSHPIWKSSLQPIAHYRS